MHSSASEEIRSWPPSPLIRLARALARHSIERRLAPWREMPNPTARPFGGWVRAIRIEGSAPKQDDCQNTYGNGSILPSSTQNDSKPKFFRWGAGWYLDLKGWGMPRTFVARFDSPCWLCGNIMLGGLDSITKLSGVYVHEDCAPAVPETMAKVLAEAKPVVECGAPTKKGTPCTLFVEEEDGKCRVHSAHSRCKHAGCKRIGNRYHDGFCKSHSGSWVLT